MDETPRRKKERAQLEEDNKKFNRQHHFIASLVDLEVMSPLSYADQWEVIRLLITHGIDNFELMDIDSHPGKWGYEYIGLSGKRGYWHHKLRQVRNTPGNDVFEITKHVGMDRGSNIGGRLFVGVSPLGVIWWASPEDFDTQCEVFDDKFADRFYDG